MRRLAWSLAMFAVLTATSASASEPLVPANAISRDEIPSPLTTLTGDPDNGRLVFMDREQGHCVLCHKVEALEAEFQGDIGPDLTEVGDRLTAGQIRLRIVDYQEVLNGALMPSYFRIHDLNQVEAAYEGKPILSAQQVEDLVAWLSTLKEDHD